MHWNLVSIMFNQIYIYTHTPISLQKKDLIQGQFLSGV